MSIEKRLERIEAILDARGLDWDHPRVEEEPAKEPEHPAGPMPDPGEGYRIVSKDPPEDLQPGDDYELAPGVWVTSEHARFHKIQYGDIWYRRKIEQPKPAWEPKVGDWVRVTRPVDWKEWDHPMWEGSMHEFDGRVGQIDRVQGSGSGIGAMFNIRIRGFVGSDGTQHYWHRNWLSPAEPSEPPEPEYREPVLPADCGKLCEFSDDDKTWRSGYLKGFDYDEHRHQGAGWRRNQNCSSDRARHRYARIKKDA